MAPTAPTLPRRALTTAAAATTTPTVTAANQNAAAATTANHMAAIMGHVVRTMVLLRAMPLGTALKLAMVKDKHMEHMDKDKDKGMVKDHMAMIHAMGHVTMDHVITDHVTKVSLPMRPLKAMALPKATPHLKAMARHMAMPLK